MSDSPSPPVDPRRWFGPDDLPWVARDDWQDHPGYRAADGARRAQADRYHHEGVVILRQAVPPSDCEAVVAAMARHLPVGVNARSTDAWRAVAPVRRLALTPEVLALIEFLYGRRPVPFQTLDFRHGTEQAAHRDEDHFDSLPPSFMCGAWVALEEVGLAQGPVVFHPGSHRPGGHGSEGSLDAVPFTAGRGDVLVWAAGLLHGGAPVTRPGATRWSQVTHYVFEDCTYYTPMHSDLASGRLALRHPLIDVGTRRPVVPALGGAPARFVHDPGRLSRLLAPGEPRPRPSTRVRSTARRMAPYLVARARPVLSRALRRVPPG